MNKKDAVLIVATLNEYSFISANGYEYAKYEIQPMLRSVDCIVLSNPNK